MVIRFYVRGEAKPGGSKRGFVNPKTGRVIITDDSGAAGKTWRGDVRDAALEAMAGHLMMDTVAVRLSVTFYRERPKGHYGSGRNSGRVRDSAPVFPTSKPDATKLLRALEDALTGIVWRDDAQVVEITVRKRWATFECPQGAAVEVVPLGTALLLSDDVPEVEGAQLSL